MRKNCLYYLAFIILIFIAALLRVHQLGVDPVWIDAVALGIQFVFTAKN